MAPQIDPQKEITRLTHELSAVRGRVQHLEEMLRVRQETVDAADAALWAVRTQVIGLAEAFLPAEVTKLYGGEHGSEVREWTWEQWASWLNKELTQRIGEWRAIATPDAGAELMQLRLYAQRWRQEEAGLREGLRRERAACISAMNSLETHQREVGKLVARVETLTQQVAALEEALQRAATESLAGEIAYTTAPEAGRRTRRSTKAAQTPPGLWLLVPFPRDEVERRFSSVLGAVPRDMAYGIIQTLAEGNECRRRPIVKLLGKTWGGTRSKDFDTLMRNGVIEETKVHLTAGNAVGLLALTPLGEEIAVALGAIPFK